MEEIHAHSPSKKSERRKTVHKVLAEGGEQHAVVRNQIGLREFHRVKRQRNLLRTVERTRDTA